jgi:alpha-1,6-mannosyltransferase
VLSWPEPVRRAAARARAERFGWPAAVQAFLAIHEALVTREAGGRGRTEDGVGGMASTRVGGSVARAAVTAERRRA